MLSGPRHNRSIPEHAKCIDSEVSSTLQGPVDVASLDSYLAAARTVWHGQGRGKRGLLQCWRGFRDRRVVRRRVVVLLLAMLGLFG